jgi:hypothetical protein
MKSRPISLLPAFFALTLASGCFDENSSTELQIKTIMLARSWTGEEFFVITVGDSSFRGKDFVERLSFTSDGGYFLYKYSMSGPGRTGQWSFEDTGNSLRLTQDGVYSEVFPIRELSSTVLVLGDTNSRGYALMPSRH